MTFCSQFLLELSANCSMECPLQICFYFVVPGMQCELGEEVLTPPLNYMILLLIPHLFSNAIDVINLVEAVDDVCDQKQQDGTQFF